MDVKKTALSIFVTLISISLHSQEKTFCFYFGSGKKVPVNLRAFKDSLEKWSASNEVRVQKITGHSDNVGTALSNQKLSVKRAASVHSVLAGMNVSQSSVVLGRGESEPAFANAGTSGRAKNRRVEIKLNLSPKPDKKTEEAVMPVLPLKPACDERDTLIILPEGTEIEIKGCSLKGISTRDIKVEASEFLTRDQMILNDMYTQTADGTCLSTGGMLRYKITDKNGRPVVLRSNQNLTIRIPQQSKDTAFSLYQMAQEGNGENTGWKRMNDTVKYLRNQRKFEVLIPSPVFSMNLDFVPGLGSAIAKNRQDRVKTKVVKNASTYINGETSVLKLEKYKPRKFKYRNCNCIPEGDQYATVIARQNDKIYYCHKPLAELKRRWFLGKKFVVRKKDYEILASKKELDQRLKADLASK